MLILGLETSCDETSVALVEAKASGFVVHKNLISSQIKIHRKYGGVVPEVAARRHVEVIIPLLKEAFWVNEAGDVKKQEIKEIKEIRDISAQGGSRLAGKDIGKEIDVIAVTAGPGLVTSLLVGVETARTLSYLWKKPLVAVNHLEGHIYANWLPIREIPNPKSQIPNKFQISNFKFPNQYPISNIQYPILCLIVSGGHTELVLMKDHLKYKLIGQTRDDAAGECFDKVGKMLGLPYPGGPEVAKLAGRGNPQAIDFPRPMIDSPDFDFSFSGLKTAALYWLRDNTGEKKQVTPHHPDATSGGTGQTGYKLQVIGYRLQVTGLNDFCASFQQAVVDVLVRKTLNAAKKYRVKTILLGGGVAANQALREQLEKAAKKQSIPYTLYPNPSYCADNAAMIAAAAYFHAIKKDFTPWQKLAVDPNWELTK